MVTTTTKKSQLLRITLNGKPKCIGFTNHFWEEFKNDFPLYDYNDLLDIIEDSIQLKSTDKLNDYPTFTNECLSFIINKSKKYKTKQIMFINKEHNSVFVLSNRRKPNGDIEFNQWVFITSIKCTNGIFLYQQKQKPTHSSIKLNGRTYYIKNK
jgi:hypothetical protein